MPLRVHQIDAFTDRPFTGNPAAVCLLPGDRPAEWMQAVAAEMALSETAFLRRRGEAFDLRWFTPAVEVDLCGHATLASAHMLWEEGHLGPEETAVFHTLSGRLTARRRSGWIEMDFPGDPPEPVETPRGVAEALGVRPVAAARSRLYLLVEVADEHALRAARPDFGRLRELVPIGVIVTCPSTAAGFDFLSRFFAPAVGVDEDPVTGSAHCVLAPYWSRRLGTLQMTGFQASARGGVVRVRDAGDRVELAGQAVTVLSGELLDAGE